MHPVNSWEVKLPNQLCNLFICFPKPSSCRKFNPHFPHCTSSLRPISIQMNCLSPSGDLWKQFHSSGAVFSGHTSELLSVIIVIIFFCKFCHPTGLNRFELYLFEECSNCRYDLQLWQSNLSSPWTHFPFHSSSPELQASVLGICTTTTCPAYEPNLLKNVNTGDSFFTGRWPPLHLPTRFQLSSTATTFWLDLNSPQVHPQVESVLLLPFRSLFPQNFIGIDLLVLSPFSNLKPHKHCATSKSNFRHLSFIFWA